MNLFLLLSLSLCAYAQEKVYSIEEQKLDLLFYKNKLEEIHPNYDFYATKESINKLFDSLQNSISSPNTAMEFYKVITQSSSVIKDGHTIILPDDNSVEYHNTNSKFLPFQLGIVDRNLVVKMNCTATNSIPDGATINSINNTSKDEILEELIKRQVRDGNNLSYAYWILDNYFRDYYSYIFGHPETYTINFTFANEEKTVAVNGLAKDSIFYYRKQKYPYFSSERLPKQGITSVLDTSNRYAVLSIKDFHDDILKNEYQQNFKYEIKAFFEKLIPSKIDHLLIDLRNNQGGDIENGITLLSYLLDQPFSAIKGYYKKQNDELLKCNGSKAGIQKPKKKIYSGNLFVLINGGSFSNSAIVSSCLKENRRAKFLGAETGGSPHVLAGFSKVLKLPNTKINIQIPTKRLVLTALEQNTKEGLKPDFNFSKTILDIQSDVDNELNWAVDLMLNRK